MGEKAGDGSDQVTDGDELVAKVRNWLVDEGYPLEYETAREMTRAGYMTFQGMFYDDPATGHRREIDVRAIEPAEPTWCCPVYVVAECKQNKHPWLVLTRELDLPRGAGWFELLTAGLGSPMDQRPPIDGAAFLLDVPLRHGMTAVTPFSKSNNWAFAALQAVVSAARGSLDAGPSYVRPSIAIPLIVLGGPMLRLGYNEAGNELLERVSWQRVLWSGAGEHPPHAMVDIVTRAELPAYLAKLRPATVALAKYVAGLPKPSARSRPGPSDP